MKEKIFYFLYKYYALLVLLIMILVMNYAAAPIMDILVKFLSGHMEELNALILTFVITGILSLIVIFSIVIIALRLRPRIFKSFPVQVPDKSNEKWHLVIGRHGSSKLPQPATSERVQDSLRCFCQCTSSDLHEMMGVSQFLHDNSTAVISSFVMKTSNSRGMFRTDFQLGETHHSCAFTINYCPKCGKRF